MIPIKVLLQDGIDQYHTQNTISPTLASKVYCRFKSFAAAKDPIFDAFRAVVQLSTSFLQECDSTQARLWCLSHQVTTSPTCTVCSNKVKWDAGTKSYRLYCSVLCKGKDSELKLKTAATNIAKYGTTSPTGNSIIKSKISKSWAAKPQIEIDSAVFSRKLTMHSRYGNDNPSKVEKFQQKKIDTSFKNWGTSHPMQSVVVSSKMIQTWADKDANQVAEIVANRIATNLVRHGVEHSSQSPIIKQKIVDTSLVKFGTTNARKSKRVKQKIINTNIERYGVSQFMQAGLPVQSLLNLNDAAWLTNQHSIQEKTITQIADELKVGHTTVGRYMKRYGIPTQRFSTSYGHKQLSQFLTELNIDHSNNDRSLISPLELDIVVPTYKLAIEYCGLYWHSDFHDRMTPDYHYNKYKLCKDVGYRLLMIYEDEWNTNRELVESKIQKILSNQEYNPPDCKEVLLDLRWDSPDGWVNNGWSIAEVFEPSCTYTVDFCTRTSTNPATNDYVYKLWDCGSIRLTC